LYLALVGLSGVVGVLFTTAVDEPAPPALFFLIELPPTVVGFALYGAATVAVVLGVPLLLVVVVSERVDDVDAVGRAGNADGDGRRPDAGTGAGSAPDSASVTGPVDDSDSESVDGSGSDAESVDGSGHGSRSGSESVDESGVDSGSGSGSEREHGSTTAGDPRKD
jgi:hypothetical protein